MAKAVGKVLGVVAGVALIATGIGAALGGTMVLSALGATIAASTIATVAGAASFAVGMLAKPPKIPDSQVQRLNASIDPRAFRKTVLGSTAMPVDIRYQEWFGEDQERCGWIVALASHAIDGVDEIWLNDELAWSASGGVTAKYSGYFWVRAIRTEGTAGDTVSFGSGAWNANHRLTGCAYAWLEFKVTGNGKKAESPFSSGIPSRVTIIGRGAKLYDPRRDGTVAGGEGAMRAGDQATWRYTTDAGATIGENLALQILRVLVGGRISGKLATGCGVPVARLDLPSFAIAANLCDELVNRSAGGTEPRYRGAGVLSEGDDPAQLLDMLCAACCGRLTDTGGKIGLLISHNDLAEAAADDGLDDDDVIGPFQWNPDPSLETTPTVVRGRYTDPSPNSLYQLLPYPDVALASGAEGPAGEVVLPLDLAVVESASQGQRVAKQALQRKQYDRTFTAPFDIRAWKYRSGQVAAFTFAPLSFNRRLFRVVDQVRGDLGECVMTLREENAAIYAWDGDDKAAVQAAEPIVYDSRNNPIILGIDEATGAPAGTNVGGVRLPDGSYYGGKPAEDVVAGIDNNLYTINDILTRQDDLEEIYGTTLSAVEAADAARIASEIADAAKVLTQAARDEAMEAQEAADAAAALAAVRVGDAESWAQTAEGHATIASQHADEAGAQASIASGHALTASTKAGEASVKAQEAATSAQTADGHRAAAVIAQQASAASRNQAEDFAEAAATSEQSAGTHATNAGVSAAAAQEWAVTAASNASGTGNSHPGAAPGSWTGDWNNPGGAPLTLSADVFVASGRLRAKANAQLHAGPIALVPVAPGRHYRARFSSKAITAGDTLEYLVAWFDESQNYIDYHFGGGVVLNTTNPSSAEIIYSTAPSAGETQIPVNARSSRPVIILRGVGSAVTEAWEASFVDVESERQAAASAAAAAISAMTATTKASEAAAEAAASNSARLSAESARDTAAGHASAASTSASTASTKATEAGSHAVAASGHADTAIVKAGEAEASAGSAEASSASASGFAAAAQQSATLSASINTGALNRSPNFADNANAAGAPTNWTDVADAAQATRVAGITGGYAYRQLANQGFERYVGQLLPVATGLKGDTFYALEADVRLNAGTLEAAGVSLQPLFDGVTTHLTMPFTTTPDDGGTAPGAGVAGRTYRFRKLVKTPAAELYGSGYLWAFTHRNLVGNPNAAACDLTWYRCAVRPATQAEIRDQTVLPAIEAAVSTQAGAVANLQGRSLAYLQQTVNAGSGATAFAELRAESSLGAGPTSSVAFGAREFHVYNPAGAGEWKKALSVEGGVAKVHALLASSAQIGYAFIKTAHIDELQVGTSKISLNSVIRPWFTSSNSLINFGSGTKTLMLSLAVAKALDGESALSVSGQPEMFGSDAVNIDVLFEIYNAASAYVAGREFRIKVDANGSTNLPFGFLHRFEGLPAGTYTVNMYGRRYDANSCSTSGIYHLEVEEKMR